MSGMLAADNQDLSFNLSFPEESEWLASTKTKPTSHGILVAVILSVTIHTIIFHWDIAPHSPEPQPDTKSIQITLGYILQPATSPVNIPDHLVEEPVAKLVPQAASKPESEIVDVNAEYEILPRQMVKQDLETIILQQSRYRDDYLSSPDSDPNTARQDHSSKIEYFNNVFDPRLRARLQNSSLHTVSQPSLSLTTLANIHGNHILELDSGVCLMATSAAIGQPTNWLRTNCAGSESESEQMMERINNDIKRRH